MAAGMPSRRSLARGGQGTSYPRRERAAHVDVTGCAVEKRTSGLGDEALRRGIVVERLALVGVRQEMAWSRRCALKSHASRSKRSARVEAEASLSGVTGALMTP